MIFWQKSATNILDKTIRNVKRKKKEKIINKAQDK